MSSSVPPIPSSSSGAPFPLGGPALVMDEREILAFLAPQVRDFGGNLAIGPDAWALFAVAAKDQAGHVLAKDLLSHVNFAYATGEAEGDAWTLYYVNTENRERAVFWLDDVQRTLTGLWRRPSPPEQAMIKELVGSATPHRVARKLADLHAKGELAAGAIGEPAVVRALLDRLHAQEPLYFSAFLLLLEHHLLDLLVLYGKMVDEDVRLGNEIVRGSISQDPFLQGRQTAAAGIRDQLLRYKILNPLDQQKHAANSNPYVAFTETRLAGDDVIIRVDGIDRTKSRQDFVDTVRVLRKNMYRGERIEDLSTQTPWVTEITAQPLRFIKQQMEARKDVSGLDWLYMLERAVDPDGRL
ncbi:MAG TPA: hypothetical protein VG838_09460 [Opitutaceae bacterium]|nr:hypothetical protein [Opitutaceae bacterium]